MTREQKSSGSPLRGEWTLPDETTYLNHGSFGPAPRAVQSARIRWYEELEQQPMEFFLRRMETHLDEAASRLAELVGADGRDLVFVENATVGMNVVAQSFGLRSGDEVLITDHEYGAVMRIWQTRCRQKRAKLVVQRLPDPLRSVDETIEILFGGVTARTRLIVVSHVTSPTAAILPVEQIARRARSLGISVCIDGPHALAMVPVDLRRIDCDFYTASCHKWLCGPFGTGFLYVRREWQKQIHPVVISWGRSVSGRPSEWRDEFTWSGTRDPTAFLAVPAAIEFLEGFGFEAFRRQTHGLAGYARRRIFELTGLPPRTPEDPEWYASMTALPLPPRPGESIKPFLRDPLQEWLWIQHGVEVPVLQWQGGRYVRVSCHFYNDERDIDSLVDALEEGLELEKRAAW